MDFRLARAILRRDSYKQALATDENAWGWSSEISELRETAFEASAGSARHLAGLMMSHPDAPWRRWACASAQPAALFDALDALGHREPAIADLGAASLPCLMGFSGLPCHTWIQSAARVSSAGSFSSSSSFGSHFFSMQELFGLEPSAFPDLPTRPGFGADLSRASDAMLMADSFPVREIVFASLGIELYVGRPCIAEPLAAACSTPFSRAFLARPRQGFPRTLTTLGLFIPHWTSIAPLQETMAANSLSLARA
jgi:hypothetical protein